MTGGGMEALGGGAVSLPEIHVALTGLDTNSGTSGSPFRTIQHAVDIGSASDHSIVVHAGVYTEQVSIAAGGTALSIQSATGELAVLDGTGLTVHNGQQGLIDVDSRSHLTIRGLEIRNFTSATSAVPLGIFVHGSGTDVTLAGNHIHHISTTVGSCNGAGGNAFGLAVYGTEATAWSSIVVSHNQLDHLTLGCSESLSINGNVDGFEVSFNAVHDNDNIGIVAIGFEGTAPTAAVDQARNGVIANNTVTDISSKNNPAYHGETSADGIYVDGGKQILIELNQVTRADLGIEIASEHSGRSSSYVLVRNNLIRSSTAAGLSVGGYASNVGNADHDVFLNNTLFDNTIELQLQFHVTETRAQNNFIFNSAGDYLGGSTTGLTQTTNLTRTGTPSQSLVDPSSTGLDFHPAPAIAALVVDQGTAFTCPAGWSCPNVWGTVLVGERDLDNTARVKGAAIDIGAFEK